MEYIKIRVGFCPVTEEVESKMCARGDVGSTMGPTLGLDPQWGPQPQSHIVDWTFSVTRRIQAHEDYPNHLVMLLNSL